MKCRGCSLILMSFKGKTVQAAIFTYLIQLLSAVNVLFICGCSLDQAQHVAYHSVQGYSQLQCKKNPTADCLTNSDYDKYQQQKQDLNSTSQ